MKNTINNGNEGKETECYQFSTLLSADDCLQLENK